MAEPTLTLTPAAAAAALDAAQSLLNSDPPAALPVAWRTLLSAGWTTLARVLRTQEVTDYQPDAILMLRLSRAGCYAAAAAVRAMDAATHYPWRITQTAHRRAWLTLATGWPAARPSRYAPPREIAGLSPPAHALPTTTAAAEYYLGVLLQDVRGLSWTRAQQAMTAIPAGVWIEGL